MQNFRIWPGALAVLLLFLARYGLPLIDQDMLFVALGGAAVAVVAVLVWWLGFSRVPWPERAGALVVIPLAAVLVQKFVDKSIATGAMGMLYVMYVIPLACLALPVWAWLAQGRSPMVQRVLLVATGLAACGLMTLLRTDGVTGGGGMQIAFRWTPTAEQRLLAAAPVAVNPPSEATPVPAAAPVAAPTPAAEPAAIPSTPPAPDPSAQWPGFRGALRDGVVHVGKIRTDWAAAPPKELWRRPVGPGWSSFAVESGLVYTQEQRGDFEAITCYELSTGKPKWTHQDKIRFWESNAGAGPRATPTLAGGMVYALGATGVLNALRASNGALVWSRNAAQETGAKLPDWGFSASPAVVDGAVIAATGSKLIAFDAATGATRWITETGKGSYSSPQVVAFDGVTQVVLLSDSGTTSVDPADGKVLWKYTWQGSSMLQPALTEDGKGLLVTASDMGGGMGTRLLSLSHGESAAWNVEAGWTSTQLKPYYNDIMVHAGHAYGFDGAILACIDLKDGKRKWKGGRYGHGQAILLAEQDLMLVLSEEGEVALVSATPGQFSELGKFHAIEGKTWNHPAFAGGVLLVRNGQEMAAYRLSL